MILMRITKSLERSQIMSCWMLTRKCCVLMIQSLMVGWIETSKITFERTMILSLLIKKSGTFLKNCFQGMKSDVMVHWSLEMTPLLRLISRKFIFLTFQEIRTSQLRQYLFLDRTQLKIYLILFDKFEKFKILKTLDFGKFGDLKTLRSFIRKLWMSIKSMTRCYLKERSLKLVLKHELNHFHLHKTVWWSLNIRFDQVLDGQDKALLCWNVKKNKRKPLV